MRTVGIIAEYNPFHLGHAYQIAQIKEQTGADYIVVAMSGDFVQRGAPALVDKYTRAKMALASGADLVLELPVLWSTASAENFAMAGVTLLEETGCVDTLCFGAETENLHQLTQLADILCEEPLSYKESLRNGLKAGLTFPAARALALSPFCDASFLSSPNNILAVEYLKALKKRQSSMTPLLIPRKGGAYHDKTLTEFSSATAIRQSLTMENIDVPQLLSQTMPPASSEILLAYLKACQPVTADDFSQILGYLLLTLSTGVKSKHMGDFSSCSGANMSMANFKPDFLPGDCTPDIYQRIRKNSDAFSSFSQFAGLCKSKDVTYTRISRIFTHMMLSLSTDDYKKGISLDYIPYLRMLGFRKDATALLSSLKQRSSVPVISKLADADKKIAPEALILLEQDIYAANLYMQTLCRKSGLPMRNEYLQQIVVYS